MARSKRTFVQRDMSLMELRTDFLERDDLEARGRSLKRARNVQPTISGAVEARPGTLFWRVLPSDARKWYAIQPTETLEALLVLTPDDVYVYDAAGTQLFTSTALGFSDTDYVWVEPYGRTTLIGHPDFGIFALTYSQAGTWGLAEWSFTVGVDGTTEQPYWSFQPGTKITPSARSGSITVASADSVFTADHVGSIIRYAGREILVTAYSTAMSITGTVLDFLPRSLRITLNDDASGFKVGQIVVGNDSNFQGIIAGINQPVGADSIDVVQLSPTVDVPTAGEMISGPSFTQEVTSSADTSNPLACPIWDEAMMSQARGWPGAACSAAGRLFFSNFQLIPNGIAVSSARDITDFKVGAEDDDAIARTIGDNNPRITHMVNSNDLILLSDRGLYYVPLRDEGIITPATFAPILFDSRGVASNVAPIQVADGVIFVEAGGRSVAAALLDGTVYLKWSVRSISDYHDQLIREPVHICGPPAKNVTGDSYILITNTDGTIAALKYSISLKEANTGFSLWETDGTFEGVVSVFGQYFPIVERIIAGGGLRYLEKFDSDIYLDCCKLPSGDPVAYPTLAYLIGKNAAFVDEFGYYGEFPVLAGGAMTDRPDVSATGQVGLNFTCEVSPWPAHDITSTRAGLFPVRCNMFMVAVINTREFKVTANAHTRTLGGYNVGEALDGDPEARTYVYRVPVFGRRYQHDLTVLKEAPGPFQIMYLGQEVQV